MFSLQYQICEFGTIQISAWIIGITNIKGAILKQILNVS